MSVVISAERKNSFNAHSKLSTDKTDKKKKRYSPRVSNNYNDYNGDRLSGLCISIRQK